ncbi:MAG: CDP-alcohol phosphatidyltransferase family protein, partial [Candidatus Bilamarchaeaceae archaeon]
ALAGAYFAYAGSIQYCFILFALAFFIDAVDGAVARAKRLTSKKGAFLDGITDRVVEFLFIVSLYLFAPSFILWLFAILFFGTCMTSFVKAYAEHKELLSKKDASSLPGLLERAERCILLLLAMALLMFGYKLYAAYVIFGTALLCIVTFLQRFWLAWAAKD